MSIDTIHCVLCGSGLTLTQGVDEDGVKWTRQRCECGRTDFLHIDRGILDLESLPPANSDDFEIFERPW